MGIQQLGTCDNVDLRIHTERVNETQRSPLSNLELLAVRQN